jgi:thioesterase domain-containing protein
MVDTTAPAARLPMLRHGWNAAGWRCGRALRDLRNRFDFALRVSREIRWRARYYGKRVGALATAGIDAQVDFARRKLRAREDGGAGQQDSPWRFYAEPPRRVDPRESYRLAYLRYVPSRYSGRVALFRAEQFPFEEPDLGWSRYLPRLEVVVVPGDHHSCITRHVTAFAAHMNAALSEAGRE